MGIFNEINKKEKPVFTGISRGLGGFGFGKAAAAAGGGGTFSLSGGTKIPAATANDGDTDHVFTGGDTWENDSGVAGEVDILLVAGGASGGISGGGGGAGGVDKFRAVFILNAHAAVDSQSCSIVKLHRNRSGSAVGINDERKDIIG